MCHVGLCPVQKYPRSRESPCMCRVCGSPSPRLLCAAFCTQTATYRHVMQDTRCGTLKASGMLWMAVTRPSHSKACEEQILKKKLQLNHPHSPHAPQHTHCHFTFITRSISASRWAFSHCCFPLLIHYLQKT